MKTNKSDQIQIVSKDRRFALPDIHSFLGLFFHSRNGLQKLRLLKFYFVYTLNKIYSNIKFMYYYFDKRFKDGFVRDNLWTVQSWESRFNMKAQKRYFRHWLIISEIGWLGNNKNEIDRNLKISETQSPVKILLQEKTSFQFLR